MLARESEESQRPLKQMAEITDKTVTADGTAKLNRRATNYRPSLFFRTCSTSLPFVRTRSSKLSAARRVFSPVQDEQTNGEIQQLRKTSKFFDQMVQISRHQLKKLGVVREQKQQRHPDITATENQGFSRPLHVH